MTRADVEHDLRLHFENNDYFSSADFTSSIQDGYDEIAAFTGIILKGAVLPFTSLVSYYDMVTLLPDYLGVVAIFNTVTKQWLLPTSLRKLDASRIDWETCYGTPYYFCPVNHRYVALYKKPLTVGYGDMYIYYRATAPTLSDSTTILFPEDYDPLEDYCKSDLWEQNQEWGKAAAHLSVYQQTIEYLRVWVRNQRNMDRLPTLRP